MPDRAKGGERRRFEVDRLRQSGQQITRHHGIFRMNGKATASTRDALTDLEACHAGAEGDNRSGRRIPKRHRLIQPAKRRRGGAEQALLTGTIQDLFHQIGSTAGFPDEGLARELDDRSLCAGRNQADGGLDQGSPCAGDRRRHIFDAGATIAEILK